MKSPVSWLTDQGYASSRPSERAIAWADSFTGERESGWNGGKFVTMLLDALSVPRGSAWCAAFASYCLTKAGVKGGPMGWRRASVKRWVDWAFHNGRLYYSSPQRGDVFAWINDNGTGHMGFVLGAPDFSGEFRTIEGNSNKAGSREGDGVYKRSRMVGKRMVYIRL